MSLPWMKGVICLLKKDGKTLFLDYRDFPHKIHQGTYCPPGGTYEEEKDQSTVDTAVREMKEEVNVEVESLVYRGTVHFNNENRTVNGNPMKINMSVDLFESSSFDDSQAQALENKEGKTPKIVWFEDAQIEKIKELHESDRIMFHWLKLYREFEGTIYQDGVKVNESKTKLISYE